MHHTLVARQLDDQLTTRFPVGRRLRVLDAGSGPGTRALRLARSGHEVTVLEVDAGALDAARAALAAEPAGIRARVRLVAGDARKAGALFRPGTFDAVLCHGVLGRVEEPGPVLAGLVRVLAPGGLLSLLVRNADALALGPGRAGEWDAALAAFDAPHYVDRHGAPARADRLAALTATLASLGAPLRAWYGVGVFHDPADDALRASEGAEREALLAAEERAARTDPYRAVAALLHLCGVRG
ncbi:methyltransferase domain-containing protein [Streptomyces sp. TRM70308]|uniref:class I SAM-dependent methyltransferase n=1 Tax=Streptomyces sp. TRM70308 TaxID=3131932 RepID=UPI003CFE16DD